jgi:hypothetical protein
MTETNIMGESFKIISHLHEEELSADPETVQDVLDEVGFDLHQSFHERSEYYIVEYTDK